MYYRQEELFNHKFNYVLELQGRQHVLYLAKGALLLLVQYLPATQHPIIVLSYKMGGINE